MHRSRAFVLVFLAALALAAPAVARGAFLSKGLAAQAEASPDALFDVIIQSSPGKSSEALAQQLRQDLVTRVAKGAGVRKSFHSVDGVAAQLSGDEILRLAKRHDLLSITEDTALRGAAGGYSTTQRWPYVSGTARFWSTTTSTGLQAPTIAIVDSGIDTRAPDFAAGLESRVIAEVAINTGPGVNSPGDGRGHGTFVAGIAAGSNAQYAGAAPNAKLVSIDVVDDGGMAMTRDVISGADWILQNKDRYDIRVANFSLHNSLRSSFRFDPLDRAVEKLWFSGIVVVAAAGNYGTSKGGVMHAPANDPFIITVGAQDIGGNVSVNNDAAAPWSAYGYTLDGFAKPDLSAPGRYMVAAIPPDSTLALERPDKIVAPGYMQMSGTSFAAPVVAGAAAYVLAVHPNWTPDQVKGALMRTAKYVPMTPPLSAGIGEVFAKRAAEMTTPPNPNAGLNRFLVADPVGGSVPVFDQASWTDAARSNTSWDAASWTDASWTDASWTDASWTDASWTDASWTDASWTDGSYPMASWTDASWTDTHFASASWTDASWTDASWTDASWTDTSVPTTAEMEASTSGGDYISAEEQAAAEAELGITSAP
jgi:serine protease AprX